VVLEGAVLQAVREVQVIHLQQLQPKVVQAGLEVVPHLIMAAVAVAVLVRLGLREQVLLEATAAQVLLLQLLE
jgi:hypothetical protein